MPIEGPSPGMILDDAVEAAIAAGYSRDDVREHVENYIDALEEDEANEEEENE